MKQQVLCGEEVSLYQKTASPQREVSPAGACRSGFLTQTLGRSFLTVSGTQCTPDMTWWTFKKKKNTYIFPDP